MDHIKKKIQETIESRVKFEVLYKELPIKISTSKFHPDKQTSCCTVIRGVVRL